MSSSGANIRLWHRQGRQLVGGRQYIRHLEGKPDKMDFYNPLAVKFAYIQLLLRSAINNQCEV
jgi:hypothetical protein